MPESLEQLARRVDELEAVLLKLVQSASDVDRYRALADAPGAARGRE